MAEAANLHRFLNGHRGKLFKQGHVFKNWKQRYFVLEKKKVKYYADEQMAKINGEYVIDVDTQIYDVPGESDGHKHLFYLCGKNTGSAEEIFYVSASSEKDKKEWIEAFSDAIHDGFKLINQPELWRNSFYPSTELNIGYPQSSVYVENGNILKPSLVELGPKVSYRLPANSTSGDKFSLIMIDFDAVGDGSDGAAATALSLGNPNSSFLGPNNKMYLHWGVINICGNDISSGDEVITSVSALFACLFDDCSSFVTHRSQRTCLLPPLTTQACIATSSCCSSTRAPSPRCS